jgi:hypothetical protein
MGTTVRWQRLGSLRFVPRRRILNANRTVAAMDELQTWAWKIAGQCKQAAAVDALGDED